jgi:trehalose/maltose hydrolase-like predicted phosphorylase
VAEVATWRHLAAHLADNHYRATNLYEQFDGFWKLEPLIIRDVAPRRPVVADLLLGGDRVHAAQVIKQADVLMLHHLVPDQVAAGSLRPNLDHYEPRTAHGSSLSPAVHASLLARAGRAREALDLLRTAMRVDLDDVTGATAAGVHLATMGGVWQAVAWGVAGLRPAGKALHIDPRPVAGWDRLDLRLRFRGSRVRVVIEPRRASVEADPPIAVSGPAGCPACTVSHADFALSSKEDSR